MNVKGLVQRFLSIFGLRLTRIPIFIEPVAPFDVLELALLKSLTADRSGFYFIQVGANNGVSTDPLNPLIRRYGLRGCLVEPLKDVFEELKGNYSDQPQIEFRNVMIGDCDGFGEIHRFKRDAPVPAEFYHGLARQDEEYIKKRATAEGLEAHTEAIKCEMQSIQTLLASLTEKRISMLCLDTEGSEDKIIESVFQAGIFPQIVNYEWTEMPLERRFAIKMKLLDHGYRFIDVGADTICLRIDDDAYNN